MHPGPLKFINTNPRNAHAALGGGAKPAASRSAGTGTFPSAKAFDHGELGSNLGFAVLCSPLPCNSVTKHLPSWARTSLQLAMLPLLGIFAAYARSYSASFILQQNLTATAAAQAIPSKPSRKQTAARCTLTKPDPMASPVFRLANPALRAITDVGISALF